LDYVRVDVDASFDEDNLKGTTGAVIRDSKGQFVAACNTRIEHVLDALSAEAQALKQGLNLAQSHGCNRVIIKSDCMEVVENMNNGAISHGVAAAVFDECYHMACDFIKISFEHVPREPNVVAHDLAREAKLSPPSVWMDDPPDFILQSLINDVTIVYNE
jgi:ribonuclease HI